MAATNATIWCDRCRQRVPYDPDNIHDCEGVKAHIASCSLLPRDGLENSFMNTVIYKIALPNGWLHYHTTNSRKSPKGFPDLVLIRERVVYAELKRGPQECPSPEQQMYLEMLAEAGEEVYVWRPTDLMEIERILA